MHLACPRACSVARARTDGRPVHPRFAAPPERTSAPASLYLHRRHVIFWGIRETGRGNIKSEGRGRGGNGGKREKRCVQSPSAGLPQVMMMISIVLFQKQTELGSIPQSCSTSREDKRAGFTVPPQTTHDLLGHPRERERLGEGTSRARGEVGEKQERTGVFNANAPGCHK